MADRLQTYADHVGAVITVVEKIFAFFHALASLDRLAGSHP